jgi:hypothetical protein
MSPSKNPFLKSLSALLIGLPLVLAGCTPAPGGTPTETVPAPTSPTSVADAILAKEGEQYTKLFEATAPEGLADEFLDIASDGRVLVKRYDRNEADPQTRQEVYLRDADGERHLGVQRSTTDTRIAAGRLNRESGCGSRPAA